MASQGDKDRNRRVELSRRDLLRGGLLLGGGAVAFGGLEPFLSLAHAVDKGGSSEVATVKDRYFIFCYFSGGWDTMLALDPRDPVVYHKGAVSKTKIDPAYEQLDDPPNGGKPIMVKGAGGKPIWLGPYIGDLTKHIDKVCIVRGMNMDTLTHEVGRRRFLTGKPPSGLLARGSSAAIWLASKLGVDNDIPNLAVRVESYNTDQPNYASGMKVGSVPDLVRALKSEPSALSPKLRKLIDATLRETANCDYAQASPTWQAAESARRKADVMVSSGLAGKFDFQANTAEMNALRAHYGIPKSGAQATTSPEAQGAMAVTAVTSGVSRVVSIQVPILDAHYNDWATDHGPNQQRGFNVVARMIEDLVKRKYPGGGTWLDHTTIIGFSEFQRTALVNQRGGRDHALANACFLAGAGIKGGTVIGKTADVALMPTLTNLQDGESDNSNGDFIRPEHIHRALLHDVGITADVADLRVEPLKAMLKKA